MVFSLCPPSSLPPAPPPPPSALMGEFSQRKLPAHFPVATGPPLSSGVRAAGTDLAFHPLCWVDSASTKEERGQQLNGGGRSTKTVCPQATRLRNSVSACAAGTLLLIQLPWDMPQTAEVAETDSKPLSISINIYFNISRVAFPLVGLACSFKYSNFHSPSLANKKERKKKS